MSNDWMTAKESTGVSKSHWLQTLYLILIESIHLKLEMLILKCWNPILKNIQIQNFIKYKFRQQLWPWNMMGALWLEPIHAHHLAHMYRIVSPTSWLESPTKSTVVAVDQQPIPKPLLILFHIHWIFTSKFHYFWFSYSCFFIAPGAMWWFINFV